MPSHLETQSDVMGMDVKKGPTPEQLAVIESVADRFNEDWELVFKTREIRRRKRNWLRVIRDFVWPRRHTVFVMYWWCNRLYTGSYEYDQSTYMPFTFPLEHDNMPFPGHPVKYRLISWRIPKRDMRYLIRGPLADAANNDVIIVDDKTTWDRAKELWKKLTLPTKAVIWLMAAVVTAVSFLKLFG